MRAGRLGLALLMAFGVELLLNMIVELYRPRTPGEAERPLPESRLLTLVTEPGGLARNVAAALDYQFGFKVTDVWFYRFLERTVIPFSALALFLMWLMTGLIVVRPEQNGVLQRFGRVANPGAPLRPGLHLKWPWPIDTVYLFPVARVQEIPIGYVPGDAAASAEPGGDLSGRVMVWSKAHNKEESKFAVASRQAADRPPLGEELRVLPVDVSFLAASIPLYFRVTDLYANQFRHRDGGATLRALAHREVTLYLANVDFNAILSTGRGQGGEELRRRIQAAADHVGLGIEIVAVGLQGLHPPVEVGKEFDAVVAAMEEMHETVLKAGTGASRAILEREGADAAVLATAHSYRQRRVEVAHAEADRFAMQLKAYSASPEMFSLNAYLEIFQNEGRNVRKYILGGETGRKVYILNLEKKLRPDLLDLDFSQPE
jgi:regulator of protease activity HflC (stomatin/prohibitin superfamily)